MPHKFEEQLVTKLLEKTKEGQVDWQGEGDERELRYTASFAGKYTITLTPDITHDLDGDTLNSIELSVRNADGDELSSLTNNEVREILSLYSLAESYDRKEIDDQLADLLKELDKPRHPTLSDRIRLRSEARERNKK